MPDIDPITNPEYTYLQVADALAARIQAGHYHGTLPGERQLAHEFGVAYQTQRHAMAVLRERGLIITRQGRGTYISKDFTNDPQPAQTTPDPAPGKTRTHNPPPDQRIRPPDPQPLHATAPTPPPAPATGPLAGSTAGHV